MEDRQEECANNEPRVLTSDQDLQITDELPEGFLILPKFSLAETDDIVDVDHLISSQECANNEPSVSTSDQDLQITDELPEGFLTSPKFSLAETDDIVDVDHRISLQPESNPSAQRVPTRASILNLHPEANHMAGTAFKAVQNFKA